MNATIIIPSLNPDEKLMQVVRGVREKGFTDILVVDDGSDAAHKGPFAEAKAAGCTVLSHGKNLGKGRALKTAFNYFLTHRPDSPGVITVDGDNQHHPEDILRLSEAMNCTENADKLLLGVRDFSGADVPSRSRIGNRTSSLLFRLICGQKISDTQTGLRAIPRAAVYEFADLFGERFDYETNMLLSCRQKGIGIAELPIRTIYIDENATSHYHPLLDSLRIAKVLLRFCASSLASFLVDILLFWLLDRVVLSGMLGVGIDAAEIRILFATVGARVCSAVVNFLINRTAVFGSKGSSLGRSGARYLVLCIAQMLASYALVTLLTLALGDNWSVVMKIVVDTLLFLASFQIQRDWVFKNEKH